MLHANHFKMIHFIQLYIIDLHFNFGFRSCRLNGVIMVKWHKFGKFSHWFHFVTLNRRFAIVETKIIDCFLFSIKFNVMWLCTWILEILNIHIIAAKPKMMFNRPWTSTTLIQFNRLNNQKEIYMKMKPVVRCQWQINKYFKCSTHKENNKWDYKNQANLILPKPLP